eukprot:8963703-Heterocapsa_arctica.AAC.1
MLGLHFPLPVCLTGHFLSLLGKPECLKTAGVDPDLHTGVWVFAGGRLPAYHFPSFLASFPNCGFR